MKLSIIVPVYNVEAYLRACVESLLKQDLQDCEILLVDDGSTDGVSGSLCDEFARAYPQWIRTIHKPNGGIGDARNTGVEAARGEYILFVDGDDYIAPETVQTLRPYMDRGIDVTVFGYWLDSEGVISRPPEERLPLEQVTDLKHFPELLFASPSPWNKLWKRALFLEHGIQYPIHHWYEDLATTGKLLAVAKTIIAVDRRMYYYVHRKGSITRNTDTARNLEIIGAIQTLLDWFREQGLDQVFQTELEALTVQHVLLTASVRVLRIDCGSPVLGQLTAFTSERFPNWNRNRYVRAFPIRHRLILALLQRRQYRLIRLLFAIKDR